MQMNQQHPLCLPVLAHRVAILGVVLCAFTTSSTAQQISVQAAAAPLSAAISAKPLDLAAGAGVDYTSSSSSSSLSLTQPVDARAAERLDLAGLSDAASQPPPRRRYGRPRYNDNMHNADGSSKYAFIAGAGITFTSGNTFHYLNSDYAAQVGVGRNFNQQFAVIAQFDYDHFGFNGRTLGNQSNLYGPNYARLDGKTHIWSFSLNPTYNFYSSDKLGAYVVAGVGFYHKVADFTIPTTGTYCDYYYGCYQYQANQTIDKYTSNAPGFSGGFGLTYKPSKFAGERLYVEARYVFVDNSQKPGISGYSSTAASATYQGNNFYAPNSNRTTYIPIKAGIRF